MMMYGVLTMDEQVERDKLRALFAQSRSAITPVVVMEFPQCTVVNSSSRKDCHVVTVDVAEQESVARHVAVMETALESWHDEQYNPDLSSSLVRICIPHSMSHTRYNRKTDTMWLDADPVKVGDKLGFQVCLRQFGMHTVVTGEHQVMTYDCMCVFE